MSSRLPANLAASVAELALCLLYVARRWKIIEDAISEFSEANKRLWVNGMRLELAHLPIIRVGALSFSAEFVVPVTRLSVANVGTGIATGKYHGAILTNSEEWEIKSVEAGRKSGDLLAPIIYCPELHFSEFASAIADMKNSVANCY
ncbi:hypothetical protein FF38_04555 [Lucilia cuprina]|uniref:Cytosol aminopeptidase domain-containing protein n=1 Tax=Lucilia cuprina TaxID=7375 RepID=A0A0L0CMJ1_LUCCU|nr:hypothetical protein FF38_04555 [Lucilia cuprina]